MQPSAGTGRSPRPSRSECGTSPTTARACRCSEGHPARRPFAWWATGRWQSTRIRVPSSCRVTGKSSTPFIAPEPPEASEPAPLAFDLGREHDHGAEVKPVHLPCVAARRAEPRRPGPLPEPASAVYRRSGRELRIVRGRAVADAHGVASVELTTSDEDWPLIARKGKPQGLEAEPARVVRGRDEPKYPLLGGSHVTCSGHAQERKDRAAAQLDPAEEGVRVKATRRRRTRSPQAALWADEVDPGARRERPPPRDCRQDSARRESSRRRSWLEGCRRYTTPGASPPGQRMPLS